MKEILISCYRVRKRKLIQIGGDPQVR